MVNDMAQLLAGLDRRPGAAKTVIAEGAAQLGVPLPADYVEFLKLANGGEGFISEHAYVMLWGIEELAAMNRSYEVQKYAPGLLIFGSNGGGEAYGFDTRDRQWPVVQVPFVGMDWTLAQPKGRSFGEFLERLREGQ
jgi:hypothetical protein